MASKLSKAFGVHNKLRPLRILGAPKRAIPWPWLSGGARNPRSLCLNHRVKLITAIP